MLTRTDPFIIVRTHFHRNNTLFLSTCSWVSQSFKLCVGMHQHSGSPCHSKIYICIKKSISGNVQDSSTLKHSFDTFHSKDYFTHSIYHIIISGYFSCDCNIQPMTESRAQMWLSILHTRLTINTLNLTQTPCILIGSSGSLNMSE